MEKLKEIAGRSLYLIVGIGISLLFLVGTIERGYEMNLAYKNPATSMQKQINELKQSRMTLRAQALQLATLNKKLEIAVTGNAKVEKKPDGTQIITGDKIELKSETDKKTSSSSSSDQVVDQMVKTASKEKDSSYPVLPYSNAFLYLNIGHSISIDPHVLALSKSIDFNIENVLVGLTVNLRPYMITLNYQHLNAHPDVIQGMLHIPVF